MRGHGRKGEKGKGSKEVEEKMGQRGGEVQKGQGTERMKGQRRGEKIGAGEGVGHSRRR